MKPVRLLQHLSISIPILKFRKNFLYALSEKIEKYWDEKNQLKLDLQIKTFEQTYSWDIRKDEWIGFLKKLKK